MRTVVGALLSMLILFCFVALFHSSAQAQAWKREKHRDWEASAFWGGSFLGVGTYRTPVEGSSSEASRTVRIRYVPSYQLGGILTSNHGDRWGLALAYSFSNQATVFTNLSDSVPLLHVRQSIHRIAYNILFYPMNREHRLRPYVFAGPGLAFFDIRRSFRDNAADKGVMLKDSLKVTVNWGAGFKCLLMKQLGIYLQFDDGISGIPSYGLPKTTGSTAGFRPEGWKNNWLVSIGINYQWNWK